jgi:flagellar biosynthesis/type III secretory pathway protein FliH
MSRLALFRSPDFTLVAERPLIKRDQVGAVDDAVGMLRRTASLREALEAECELLRARAREEGRAQGLALGRQEAAKALGQSLARLDRTLAVERAATQARVVQLALALVERVAADLGPATVVAALAARALAELDPARPVRLRVHPAVARALGPELATGSGNVQVIAAEHLGAFDCELDTGNGRIEAGLPLQLEALGVALEAASRAAEQAHAVPA